VGQELPGKGTSSWLHHKEGENEKGKAGTPLESLLTDMTSDEEEACQASAV